MCVENKRIWLEHCRTLTQQKVRWRPETWADSSSKDLKRIPLDGQIYQCRVGDKSMELRGFWNVYDLNIGNIRLNQWSRTKAHSLQSKFNKASMNKWLGFVSADGLSVSIMRTH